MYMLAATSYNLVTHTDSMINMYTYYYCNNNIIIVENLGIYIQSITHICHGYYTTQSKICRFNGSIKVVFDCQLNPYK